MKKKYILGINDLADPSISIVRNGRVIFYCEEERLTRIKHSHNMFPILSIKQAFKTLKISLSDIECITYNWNLRKYENGMMKNFFKSLRTKYKIDKNTLLWQNNRLKNRNKINFVKKLNFNLKKHFTYKKLPKVKFFSHHYVHAFQSFKHSNFTKAICITIDGSGEENCTVIWKCNGNKIIPIKTINMPNSLGWFYSAFTEFFGFKAYDGEYKLMGLAAYGKPNKKLREKVRKILNPNPKSGNYILDPSYIHYGKHSYSGRFTDKLVKIFEKKPPKKTNYYSQWYKDLAYEIQSSLEDSVINLIKKININQKVNNFCIGGGVGLNIKLNSKLFEQKFVKDYFANPLCPDSGASVGSALLADSQINSSKIKKLKNLSLGPKYTNRLILKEIKKSRLNYMFKKNIHTIVSAELAKGNIIGWFQGSMEAGPRALGNISIIADPRNKKVLNIINKKIKFREIWRPFCPSILKENVAEYFDSFTESKFMTISFKANSKLKKIAPAIVHVDGTSRIQSVDKSNNKKYYRLINEFYKKTKVPVILNTSFNIKGEPIVCSPSDAIKTFINTDLDILVLENYIIYKK